MEHRRSASVLYGGLKLKTPDSIRILHLLPGEDDAELRISLSIVTLDSKPRYKALSYTWGASTEGHAILVNDGCKLHITDNLFRALRGLRNRLRTRVMWIDAICINQTDLEERTQQVTLMGRIYHEASCVDVWLGEYRLPVKQLKLPKGLDFGGSYLRGLWKLPLSRAMKHPRATLSRMRNWDFKLIRALAANQPPWDSRAWTIQEFMLAKRVYICFGRNRIQYHPDAMRAMLSASVTINTNRLVMALNDRKELARRYRTRSARESNQEMQATLTMLDVTRLMVNTKASDPRDLVYSTMGLIDPEERRLIGIDYSLPCSMVYARATFASVKQSGGFQIFYSINVAGGRLKDLPTWSVDFSSLPQIFENRITTSGWTQTGRHGLLISDSHLLSRPAYLLDLLFWMRLIDIYLFEAHTAAILLEASQ